MTYFGLKGYVVHGEEFPLRGRPTFKKDLVTSQKSKIKEFTRVTILKCFLGKTKGNVKA